MAENVPINEEACIGKRILKKEGNSKVNLVLIMTAILVFIFLLWITPL